MGYELHITRAEDWTDSAEVPISLEEWLAFVAVDPELRHDGVAATTLPDGGVFEVREPGLVVWTAHPQAGKGEGLPWIRYVDGQLQSKHPDPPFLRKMHEIATALGARLQGDDGENYAADGSFADEQTVPGAVGAPAGERAPADPSMRMFLTGLLVFVAAAVATLTRFLPTGGDRKGPVVLAGVGAVLGAIVCSRPGATRPKILLGGGAFAIGSAYLVGAAAGWW